MSTITFENNETLNYDEYLKEAAERAARYARTASFDIKKEGIESIEECFKVEDEDIYITKFKFKTKLGNTNSIKFTFAPMECRSTIHIEWNVDLDFERSIEKGATIVGSKSGAQDIFTNAVVVSLASHIKDKGYVNKVGGRIILQDSGNDRIFFENGICYATIDSMESKHLTPRQIIETLWFADYFFEEESLTEHVKGLICR